MLKEARELLGNVNIFPTLFLVDRKGTIVKYYVNYQPREALEKEIEKIGGGGVFLWSVRAVTSSGKREPASQYRWL